MKKLIGIVLIIGLIALMKTDAYSKTAEQAEEVAVMAGPGEQYAYIETIKASDVDEYITEENGYLEVKYKKHRGYILKSELNDTNIDYNQIPLVQKKLVVQGPTQRKYLANSINLDYVLTCDIAIYDGPNGDYEKRTDLKKGITVKILRRVDGSLRIAPYYFLEYSEDGKPWRGYSMVSEVDDVNNPIKDFDQFKVEYGCFEHDGKIYYSCPIPWMDQYWKTEKEFSISNSKFDFLQFLTGMIMANDLDAPKDGMVKDIYIQEYESDKFSRRISIGPNRGRQESADAVLALPKMLISGLARGYSSDDYRVCLETCRGENRIIIQELGGFIGENAGKTLYLSDIILNNDPAKFFGLYETADKYVRSIYTPSEKDGKCDLEITYSSDALDSLFVSHFFFDNTGELYCRTSIDSDNTIYVVQNHKRVELINYLFTVTSKCSNEFRDWVVNELKNNGVMYHDRKIIASSTLKNYNAENVIDNDPKTAWFEGVTGTGAGEYLTFVVKEKAVYGIDILPGYTKNQLVYEENAVPISLSVESGEKSVLVEAGHFVPNFNDIQPIRIIFDSPIEVVQNTVKLSIISAQDGTKSSHTGISEVKLLTHPVDLLDNEAVLGKFGYKKYQNQEVDRVFVNGNNIYNSPKMKDIDEGVYLFDYRSDLDGDGEDEILTGITAANSSGGQEIALLIIENKNGEWIKGESFYLDMPMSTVSQGSEYVFLKDNNIFVESWSDGIIATGHSYRLYKYSYANDSFDEETDGYVAYDGSDITSQIHALSAGAGDDSWVVNEVNAFKNALYKTGLQAPEGLTKTPLYLQNDGTIPLLAIHHYFTGDHLALYDWMSNGMKGEFPYGVTKIQGLHENEVFKEGNSEFILEDSSERKLSTIEVNNLEKDEIQMAINEIYARHGYIFSTAEVKEYFNSLSWYKGTIPSSDFNTGVFSEVENYNIQLLQEYYGYK